MNPIANWRFGVWRPAVCRVRGHKVTCYGITPAPGIISGYVYICKRCLEMTDHEEPCGTCTNMCKDREEEK